MAAGRGQKRSGEPHKQSLSEPSGVAMWQLPSVWASLPGRAPGLANLLECSGCPARFQEVRG
ncbi:hypothetical protein GCM10010358_38860 [Streptomyces minutiscleroticus]|uniref:Uncharacterized protein n=1 Tax=Streptomyces minutiscleroticus TaxID=68238 RepID=A0A918NMF4_9ACTN|nr:hypothetical protein GCM10010358_38860 [Streptomyces minutiscleroticus]